MRKLNRKFIVTTFVLLLLAFVMTGCSIFEVPVKAGAPAEPTVEVEPVSPPVIQVFPETVIPGSIVSVLGEGWPVDDMILVSLDDPTDNEGPKGIHAHAIVAGDGSFVTSFTYPRLKPWSDLTTVFVVAQTTELTESASAILGVAVYVEDVPPVLPPAVPPQAPVEPTEPDVVEPEPVPAPPTPLEATVLAGALNVRTGPGVNFGVIKAIPQRTSVPVLGQNLTGTWLKVQLSDGTIGWLSKAYTDFVGTVPPETGPAAPVPPTPIPTPVPPAPQPPIPVITEWRGDYFANRSLSGTPSHIRNDYDINFAWGGGPTVDMPADNFSVRWTRNLYLDQGLHRFHSWVDDGMRLYIDNTLVIDAWYDSGVHEVSGEYTVWAGYHEIRVEYYEHTGEGVIRVWWERITDQSDTSFPDWKAEYFDNRKLDDDPVVKRNETDINHHWGSGSPGYGLPADNFSVRWTDRLRFKSGQYTLKVKVDDGVRVWIDGDRIIDSWQEDSRTIYKDFEIYNTDRYDVKVEYYERWGTAEIEVSWERKGSIENEPKAQFNGPYHVNEGSTATYDGSPSYDTDGNIDRYHWDLDYRDNHFTVDAEGKMVNVHFPDGPSMRRIALRVTDDDTLRDVLWRDIVVENVAPQVEADAPYAAQVGQAINMTGSAVDPSPQDQVSLSYHWDFGDGTQANGNSVSHTYGQPGSYTAHLTVTDKDGAQGTATTVVQVAAPANQSPTAVIQGPTRARVGEQLNFAAGASSDPDGILTSYSWDFGDGTTASGSNTNHSYGATGNFKVSLTVTDDDGLSDTTRYTVVIEPQTPVNQAPVARINGPGRAEVGETAIFDSGGSYDPDGSIESYIWDFGDGPTASRSAAESTVAHIYQSPGSYQVTLTVVDNGGLQAIASHTIVVEEPPPANQAPVAKINGPGQAKVGETAIFDSGGSYDPDGSIESYIWDFGDGPTASRSAAESTVAHVYQAPGNYQVTLTVVDNGGLQATAAHTIVVEEPPPANQSPVARINGPGQVEVGETAIFDSGGSYDPDGSIENYIWDFGDGPTASRSAAESTVAHVYQAPGSYQVTLTVVDNDGLQATAAHTINVEQPPAPNQAPRAVIAGPTKAMAGETVTFNGGSSSDPDGNIVGYAWNLGDGTTANSVNVSHSYGSPGNYKVKLTVTDDLGVSDSTTYTVVIIEPINHNLEGKLEPHPDQDLVPGTE